MAYKSDEKENKELDRRRGALASELDWYRCPPNCSRPAGPIQGSSAK